MNPSTRPTIRLSSPGEMAIAIPMLLGYHPEDSLVISCLTGPAVGLTMRFDLAHVEPADAFIEELADRIDATDADVTFIAVFVRDRPRAGRLPHAALVEALYADERLRVADAVLVSRRHWWSYLCTDPICCPPAGRPIDDRSPVATSLSAAFALSGSAVLTDRAALVASLAFDDSLDRRATERRLSAARRAAQAMTGAARGCALRDLVEILACRFADPRAEATDEEVAQLAALLHDVGVRDALLVQAVPPQRRETLLRLLRQAVAMVPPPHDAPICTALAWFAYADGDGTTANIALDRALESDRDYSLAQLIVASLARQLPPSALVEVMQGAARDIDVRDAAG